LNRGYRAQSESLIRQGKVEVFMRSPTYREIGVKNKATVSWFEIKLVLKGCLKGQSFCMVACPEARII